MANKSQIPELEENEEAYRASVVAAIEPRKYAVYVPKPLKVVEKEAIEKALIHHKFVLKDVYKSLGITYRILKYKCDKHGIPIRKPAVASAQES